MEEKLQSKTIIEVKEIPISASVIGLLCLSWIVFASFKIQLNSTFFYVSIIFAMLFILILPRRKMVMTEKEIIFVKDRLLSFLQTKDLYKLDNIKNVTLEKSETTNISFFTAIGRLVFSLFLGRLFSGGFSDYPETIFIELKDGGSKRLRSIGATEDVESLVRTVQKKLQKSS